MNQFIEVRPGIVTKDASGNSKCTPIYSRVVSLFAEQNELQFAVPGGLIGVGTTMDPSLTRGDKLVGQVLGSVGSLPDIFIELEVYIFSFQIVWVTILLQDIATLVSSPTKQKSTFFLIIPERMRRNFTCSLKKGCCVGFLLTSFLRMNGDQQSTKRNQSSKEKGVAKKRERTCWLIT